MEAIDTHDVEVAFDELIKELCKLKELNDLVDAYKNNIDVLSSNVNGLAAQIESFYNSAKEHDNQVNILYEKYVDEGKSISEELATQIESFQNSAKEHDNQLNILYKKYVDEAENISSELGKRSLEFKQIGRRSFVLNVISLILGILSCAGLSFLIFFA